MASPATIIDLGFIGCVRRSSTFHEFGRFPRTIKTYDAPRGLGFCLVSISIVPCSGACNRGGRSMRMGLKGSKECAALTALGISNAVPNPSGLGYVLSH